MLNDLRKAVIKSSEKLIGLLKRLEQYRKKAECRLVPLPMSLT